MDVEREALIQTATGVISVVVFTALVVVVGARGTDRTLDPSGALVLVGVMAFFIVFMAALGLVLSDELTGD